MSFVIQLYAIANDDNPLEGDAEAGQWLKDYDPDAYDGVGLLTSTAKVEEAKHYETSLDAATEWKRVSTVRPVRVDGQPNRPLSAWSISVTRHDPLERLQKPVRTG